MQTNTIPVTPARQHSITPETRETLRTLRAAAFRLEADYFSLDWESRLELAEGLRSTLDDLDAAQADVIAHVAEDLDDEFEDFSLWETRADAARRVRLVITSIEQEVRADA
jgi:hypothetical protein